jgi:hypothetical protein
LLATYYQAKVLSRMEVGQPRKKRIDILREKLAAGSGTFADVQSIARSVNLMKGRYMARPAAELLVERGDPMASEIAKGLAMTPVLGRDPSGDLLRAAFKQALAKEGIPADVDEMARRFYAGRGHASKPQQAAPAAKVDAFGWDVPGAGSGSGGILGAIRRMFGGGGGG